MFSGFQSSTRRNRVHHGDDHDGRHLQGADIARPDDGRATGRADDAEHRPRHRVVCGAGYFHRQEEWSQSRGTAFVIDDKGHLLTNEHVVAAKEDGKTVVTRVVQIQFSDDPTLYDARVVGVDAPCRPRGAARARDRRQAQGAALRGLAAGQDRAGGGRDRLRARTSSSRARRRCRAASSAPSAAASTGSQRPGADRRDDQRRQFRRTAAQHGGRGRGREHLRHHATRSTSTSRAAPARRNISAAG